MDQVTVSKSEYRSKKWMDIIRACRCSGQTTASWCKSNGVNIKSYYYRLRKFRLQILESSRLPAATPAVLEKLALPPSIPSSGSQVVLHVFGATPEVKDSATRQTLEAVLLALKSVC